MTYSYFITYRYTGLAGTVTHGVSFPTRIPPQGDISQLVKAIETRNGYQVTGVRSLHLEEWVSADYPPRPDEQREGIIVDLGPGRSYRCTFADFDGSAWHDPHGQRVYPERWLLKTLIHGK